MKKQTTKISCTSAIPIHSSTIKPKACQQSHTFHVFHSGAGKAVGIETFGFVSIKDRTAVATKCRWDGNKQSSKRETPGEVQNTW